MTNFGAKGDAVIGEEARRKAIESIIALHGEGERTRAGLGVAAAAGAVRQLLKAGGILPPVYKWGSGS